MPQKSNENYIGKGLNYIKTSKGLYFYYDNNLLIIHNDNIPFVTLVLPDKKVPLYGCNVIKSNINEFTIEFFQSGYSLDCKIIEKDGIIRFLIENNNYPCVILSLYKEKNQEATGLIEGYRNKKVTPEKKLSFYIKNKYIFQNINIKKYDLKILDKIFISVYQKRICFVLDTVNTPDELQRMTHVNLKSFKSFNEQIIFELTEDLYSISDYYRDGLIIKDCDQLDMVDFLSDHYGKIIYCLRPVFRKDSHFVSYFSGKELLLQKDGLYKIDFKELGAVDGFKTVVRKYFDTRLEGIYLDSSDYNQEEVEIMREAISDILSEYTKKIILFDCLPLTNRICGYYVIKDKNKLFNHPEELQLYRCSGEYYLAAEVRNYEEIEKVPDECKIIIVNNTL